MADDIDGPRPPGAALPGHVDPDLRKRAEKRLRARREFRQHAAAYLVVNTFLVILWFITLGPGDYFWPVWPMLGWGIGLAFHALSLRDEKPTAQQIETEARRLAERDRRYGPQDTL